MILKGKKALILGIANERSIAWGVAQAFKEQGARLGLTYAGEAIKKRLDPLAQKLDAEFVQEVDVTQDSHIEGLKNKLKEHWGEFDILVHSLAFADREDLKKDFSETSREGFKLAMDVSAYSLVALAGSLKELMPKDSSIMSMSYHGSQKVVSGYNVMGVAKAALECSSRYLADDLGRQGIRVNCISAGPIRTLAASGVPGLRTIFEKVEERSPLRDNVTPEDVAGAAVYLGSDLSKKVSGQILYVDSGMSTLGV